MQKQKAILGQENILPILPRRKLTGHSIHRAQNISYFALEPLYTEPLVVVLHNCTSSYLTVQITSFSSCLSFLCVYGTFLAFVWIIIDISAFQALWWKSNKRLMMKLYALCVVRTIYCRFSASDCRLIEVLLWTFFLACCLGFFLSRTSLLTNFCKDVTIFRWFSMQGFHNSIM